MYVFISCTEAEPETQLKNNEIHDAWFYMGKHVMKVKVRHMK